MCTSCKRYASFIVFAWLACVPLGCRADTVASLLGNFTVNQYGGLRVAEDAVNVHYAVVFGQLPALRELHLADADGDGVTTQAERDVYAERLAPAIARQLNLDVDGIAIPLRAVKWTTSLPTEQGGFSLRLDVDFAGMLPAAAGTGDRTLTFSNQNYPGQFGWQEIVVETAAPLQAFDTNAFSTSLTGGLTQALQSMPASGPLAEREVHLRITNGAVPKGTRQLGPRADGPADATVAAGATPDDAGTPWLTRQTRRVIDLISTANVSLPVTLFALLAAASLGALHAFAPGHGKTVVGAYLIGSRGTPRHAAFLGLTVTITHTLGVFALGFATLAASRYFVPERLLPALSLVSGLLVLCMGCVLLLKRWRGIQGDGVSSAQSYRRIDAAQAATHRSPLRMLGSVVPRGNNLAFAGGHHHHAGSHAHAHDPLHGAGQHRHDGGLAHSHGGTLHTHLPPGASGEKITWGSLLTLGISGGLVPCPSAMVLLLAAVALNKTAWGLALVLAFSVGLAISLTLVGLAFLYARNRFPHPRAHSRWPQWLAVASAAAITAVGAAMSWAALVTFS
jgi:ABC-type nickel/cobalt efflux system permease component RcnA